METQAGANRLREKLVFRYTTALEYGDFDTLAVILEIAEQDLVLEIMITEVNHAYVLEENSVFDAEEVSTVRDLLFSHIPSGMPDPDADEPPPLTVGDVVTRIQSDNVFVPNSDRELASTMNRLQSNRISLPTNLTLQSIRELFGRIGIRVNTSFEKTFRDTAIFLSLGHEQNRAQLAATRRQQSSRTKNRIHDDKGESTNSKTSE